MSDINEVDSDGRTALHRAAKDGNTPTVKLLIEAGAAVDAKDKYGRTALQRAAWSGNSEPAILLLQAGADISIAYNNGKTARDIAIHNGHHTWVSQIDAWCAANEARVAVDKLLQSSPQGLTYAGGCHT